MLSTLIRTRKAKALAGLLFLAVAGPMCGGGGGGGGGAPAGGGATFSVIAHSPTSLTPPVARTATIYLTVNGVVDPATLPGNITLVGTNPIPTTATYNSLTSMIEIVPNPFMNQGVLHTLTIGSGVKTTVATGGLSLNPTSFTFTTVSSADTGLPTFGGAITLTGIGTTTMTVGWAAGTDTGTGATAQASLLYDVYLATTTGAHNFASPPSATSAAGATSVLLSPLPTNTNFFVRVFCRDAAGNRALNTNSPNAKTLVSFETDIYNPIVNTICIACHIPSNPNGFGFMDLSGGHSDVVNNWWVNQTSNMGAGPPQVCQSAGFLRVNPGSPSTSLVYLKISQTTPPCGMQMPEGGPYLSPAQQAVFFNWISEGAFDN